MPEAPSGPRHNPMDRPSPSENPKTPFERARAFVQDNMVGVTHKVVACGDGRYGRSQLPGALRVFGADTGFLGPAVEVLEGKRALLIQHGVELTADDYVQGYLRAIKRWRGADAVIETHADVHNPHHKKGCGYEKNLSDPDNADIYHTQHSRMIGDVLTAIDNLPDDQRRTTELEKEHHVEEADIVIRHVDGEPVKWSVFSQSADGSQMYFVEDMSRIEAAMDTLHGYLLEEWGLSNMPEDVFSRSEYGDAFQRFRLGTAAILAENKPIFEFTIGRNGDIVDAKDLGTIPTKAQRIASDK